MQNYIDTGNVKAYYPVASNCNLGLYLNPNVSLSPVIAGDCNPALLRSSTTAASSVALQSNQQSLLQQVYYIAQDIAQSVANTILQKLLPAFGICTQGTSISGNSGVTSPALFVGANATQALVSSSSSGNTATQKTATQTSWIDSVQKWFGNLGKFGTGIKNTLQSGQALLEPFSGGLSSLWTGIKDVVGGIVDQGSSLFSGLFDAFASIF